MVRNYENFCNNNVSFIWTAFCVLEINKFFLLG